MRKNNTMKKMNKFVSILTLALGAALSPAAWGATGGDIVDIRVMDDPAHDMYFNGDARNTDKGMMLCSADHPLTAGDKVYFRIRMLVRNYMEVQKLKKDPWTWTFKPGALGGSVLNRPKLGLYMGEDRLPAYAEFSDYGPEIWQRSGALVTDDLGNTDPDNPKGNWRYYTDLYFVYTIQPGDLSLPIRLLNGTGSGPASDEDVASDYYILNCKQDGTDHWVIGDSESNVANLYYGESGDGVEWPEGDESTRGPCKNFDLHQEGAYVKTIDFGLGDNVTENYWRTMPERKAPKLTATLQIQGGKTTEAMTVYLWSSNETAVVLQESGNNKLTKTKEGLNVLKVPVAAGATSVTFAMKGADGGHEGDVSAIFLSPVASIFAKTATGLLEANTVYRDVIVGPAEPPEILLRWENGETVHDAVTADPDYMTPKAQLVFTPSERLSAPVTVRLTAKTSAGDNRLQALYDANVIRIPSDAGFDMDGKITEVTIPAGSTAPVTRNLFVLGATEETEGSINFKIEKLSGPADVQVDTYAHTIVLERAGEEGITVTKANPAADTSVPCNKDSTKAFKVQFTDTYKNITKGQTGYKGYTFTLTDIDSGDEVARKEGISLNNSWFTFNAEIKLTPGTYNVILQALAPDGVTTTVAIPYELVVADSKHAIIEPTDGRYTIGEGERPTFSLYLNQKYSGDTKFMFVKPATEADKALADTTLYTIGATVDRDYQYVSVPQQIRFLDGTEGGTPVNLAAFLGNTRTNPEDPASGWGEGNITLTVTNKPPVLKSLMIAGQRVTVGSSDPLEPVSSGVAKTFKLLNVDDVDIDLQSMDVLWDIDGQEIETHGHYTNETSVVITNFPNAKASGAIVRVYLKDKDMPSYPADPNFETRVTVLEKPYVAIQSAGSTYLENEVAGQLSVTLSERASAEVVVRLKITPAKMSDGGFIKLRLSEGSVAEATDEDGNVLPGEYDLTFGAGVQQKVLTVAEMDGTNESLGGFDFNVAVITETLNPDGVRWCDFYMPGSLLRPLTVQNVPPTILRPTDAEAAYTNENASANVEFKISYGATDVTADMTNEWTYEEMKVAGLVVNVTIDGSPAFTTNVTDNKVRTWNEAKFNGEGSHVVEVTFTDKDGMTSRRTMYYFVKPSKRLQLRAHGPATALGTSGGFSMHYGAAAGLGAGRVFAGVSKPQSVEDFVHLYSFNETETSISAYAAGYKVAHPLDDGTLVPFKSVAITPTGKMASEGSTDIYCYTNAYDYVGWMDVGFRGYDSFLYGWACNNTESTSGTSGNGGNGNGDNTGNTQYTVYSFLLNIGDYGETTIPLPTTDDNSQGSKTVAYPIQYWEAVFSREMFKPDNCGDINQDYIPDIVVYNFGMGIVDTTTYKLITTESAQTGDGEAAPEGDLTDLKDYNKDKDKDGNDDPDYLPGSELSLYTALIPGLKATWAADGVAFDARKEVRGYHDGLNDALPQLGIASVKSDRIYAVEDADGNWGWDEQTCTISKLEFAAWCAYAASHELTWSNATDWAQWSPERPTKPTRSDTDGDGFADGYEYYFWYRAHVGDPAYFEQTGKLRRLTGRRYDPKNPGTGTLISSEECARLMDPRSDLTPVDFPKSYIDPANAVTRDTDNDGLPDLIEFEIGTNPLDFDTDGDGLPDGWEIMFAGTDPTTWQTEEGLSDAMRNYDGDAMAFTSPRLERTVMLPTPLKTDDLFKFALVDPDGDTDGVQWYVTKTPPAEDDFELTPEAGSGTLVKVGGKSYVTEEKVFFHTDVNVDAFGDAKTNLVLAADLPAKKTWSVEERGEDDAKVTIRLMPTRLPLGTALDEAPDTETPVGYAVLKLKEEKEYSAAWVYGNKDVSVLTTGDNLANLGGFGFLAVGRYRKAPTTQALAALPAKDEDIGYLHSLVYQEFRFDPRTAWNANTPLAARWGRNDGQANNYDSSYGYAGCAARTREYTTYDEFLVYSWFLNNGTDTGYQLKLSSDKVLALARTWGAFTTNPQGPGEAIDAETALSTVTGDGTTVVEVKYFGKNSDNGADTDEDGVPDGWELYVMAGPKVNGRFRFAGAYNDGYLSGFGPFVGDAAKAGVTDNTATSGYATTGGDGDGLTELQEFAGTDSCNYYSKDLHAGFDGSETVYSTTIVRPAEHAQWLNKFFPTDPWNADTDADGITDRQEFDKIWSWAGNPAWFRCANFIYGTPVDDGSACIPGGGLNPLTMDTDGDGLPDLWESQFAGSKIYDGEDAEITKDADGKEGNPKQGLMDGMDATVWDACSYPVNATKVTGEDGTVSNSFLFTSAHGAVQVVNRDYDHDGLENWQEYMTGLMRCWRYDDPVSRWDSIPESWYFNADGAFKPDLAKFGFKDMNEFWYETLENAGGRYYNPHLVTGMNPANYMTRVENGWDRAFTDEGTYYWLPDRVGGRPIAEVWGAVSGVAGAPLAYACCSPIDSDSDQDGMDDYYELFHGLNPLLGESGKEATSGADDTMAEKRGPCDLVYSAWMGSAKIEAWNGNGDGNYWQKDPGLKAKSRALVDGGYDFAAYPWLNGLQAADPDGDDIRNVNEAIMPKLATETWNHADPTPLWMTDSTYSNSLTRLFFRMQTRFPAIDLSAFGESFTNAAGQEAFFFRDYDGFRPADLMNLLPVRFVAYQPDFWSLSAEGENYNWMYSFEENEGFDTDHDGLSDYEEGRGEYRSATDMQDADSPRRRQAMYFPGKDAALQTLPEEQAHHPIDDRRTAESPFLTYTVECWAMPERVTGSQTILERAIWTQYSNPGDEEFMRKNFQLAIRNGKWYTKFDPNGTLKNNAVEIYSSTDAEVGKWTHLAAVFDGSSLNLYVNGVQQVAKDNLSLQPECGTSVLAVRTENAFGSAIGDYWFSRRYDYKAIVVGASVRGRTEKGADGKTKVVNEKGYLALDLSRGMGWNCYEDFYQGYVDEIRIWDGARDYADILGDYLGETGHTARYTREEAIANRGTVYSAWSQGKRRAVKGDELEPELRYHWTFDSVFGAENAKQVLKSPHGFELGYGKAYLSRPVGYTVDWWAKIVAGDGDNPGYGSVYAGTLDWVTWIPNTVAHLPFYDYTTLDSVLWSENYCGDVAGTYPFARTAEPVSRWTQMTYNGIGSILMYQTTGTRHRFVNEMLRKKSESTLATQFEFTGRNQLLTGSDLLPLGGAFAKYVDKMWDEQGASSPWEYTGADNNGNGLPEWWETYADQNYRPDGIATGEPIDWNTELLYDGKKLTAGAAYLRDLARGLYLNAWGTAKPGEPGEETAYRQTAKADGLIPDWWKELMKIEGEEPLADTDRDGLNNYVEYVASELLPFSFVLNPRMARTNTTTLDYFRKVGKLYVGEMLTDHDQMEDHWERSLGDTKVADPTLWDASKDAEEDGWTNFAENRYNGYSMSTLAQLVSHAMGDTEVLDAPVPSIKLTVRYNGVHFTENENPVQPESTRLIKNTLPPLVVRTFTDDTSAPDAEFTVRPGVTVEKEVYLGGWENRVIRGTMAPGNIDLGSVNLKFAQVPQSDLYSWTDESGLHLARPYSEFKDALQRNPDIIQNIQDFTWLELVPPSNEYTSSDRAVTVARDTLTQKGVIAVYGQRVGTVDLTTGDFEFNMAAMMDLQPNYTYSTSKEGAWSYKEAIFKFTYSATVPTFQANKMNVTLAAADAKYVKEGKNTIMAFLDLNSTPNGEWDPGEPFGVIKGVDIGWAGREVELELTDTSAITPRIALWADAGDRVDFWGDSDVASNRVVVAPPTAARTRVRVVRAAVDGQPVDRIGVEPRVVLDRTFDFDKRRFLQEGDFLDDGAMDIDWDYLTADVAHLHLRDYMLTNVTYRVVVGDGPISYEQTSGEDEDTNTVITALGTAVERRFESARTVPTLATERTVFNRAQPTFAWKLDREDTTYAARYGTTYTAFKVVVKDGTKKVYESPVTRMPPCDSTGTYSWTAPLYIGMPSPSNPDVVFENLKDYTWQVYVYNAKFNWDASPSAAQAFRMQATDLDTSSGAVNVRVCYCGPATNLLGRVHVQAFTTPDFTGDPVAETIVRCIDPKDTLSPNGRDANAKLFGLAEGEYFIRAYIDTNGNGRRDDWESFGYLSERDRANKPGIFNPVALTAAYHPLERDTRQVFVEDCDTNGNWFPDAWEMETYGSLDAAPADGDMEWIAINPELKSKLDFDEFPVLQAISSRNGLALLAGVSPTSVHRIDGSKGTAGIAIDNRVEAVKITALDFMDNGNVALTIEAATAVGEIDAAVMKLYELAQSGELDVVCTVYRKSSLSDKTWAKAGSQVVRVGGGEVTVTVSNPVAGNGGFYKIEVSEKK